MRIVKYHQSGFTAAELFITMVVVTVLLTMAVPSFTIIAQNNRIKSQMNDFHLSLLLARSEAITRISRVSACRSNTSGCLVSGTCACAASGNWEQGWIVFTDDDNDGVVDLGATPAEEILSIREPLRGGTTLRGQSGESVASYVSYIGNGQSTKLDGSPVTATTTTIALCDSRGASEGRAISFNGTGRPGIVDATDCTP